jgi:hypothetical protein
MSRLRSLSLALGLLLAAGTRAPAQPPAPSAPPAPVEATSLLGAPLARPALAPETQRRMEAQLDSARATLAADPRSADARIWVARRLGYLGRFREAIDELTRGIAEHPRDPRMYRHRGHRYLTVRDLPRAAADLERAATLMRGRPDEVEPDGQPNARNQPIGTLHSNVWYHLALARYLQGDDARALQASRAGLAVSTVPDRLVSQTYWTYLILRRMGRAAEARAGAGAHPPRPRRRRERQLPPPAPALQGRDPGRLGARRDGQPVGPLGGLRRRRRGSGSRAKGGVGRPARAHPGQRAVAVVRVPGGGGGPRARAPRRERAAAALTRGRRRATPTGCALGDAARDSASPYDATAPLALTPPPRRASVRAWRSPPSPHPPSPSAPSTPPRRAPACPSSPRS